MKINRCSRCGNFFTAEGNICPNCMAKEKKEVTVFKNYIENNTDETSLNNVSFQTGISQANLKRFLGYDDLKKYGKILK